MGRYADNLKAQAAATAQTATDTAQTAAIAGLLTQGTADLTTEANKPKAKNLLYFNTSTQKLYVSTGTTQGSWTEVKAVAIV